MSTRIAARIERIFVRPVLFSTAMREIYRRCVGREIAHNGDGMPGKGCRDIGGSIMTPKQIELARHALGLPNKSRTSYRNRFVTTATSLDYDDWLAMVASGDALRVPSPKYFGSMDYFYLTPAGAHAALLPREKLDEEDFGKQVKLTAPQERLLRYACSPDRCGGMFWVVCHDKVVARALMKLGMISEIEPGLYVPSADGVEWVALHPSRPLTVS